MSLIISMLTLMSTLVITGGSSNVENFFKNYITYNGVTGHTNNIQLGLDVVIDMTGLTYDDYEEETIFIGFENDNIIYNDVIGLDYNRNGTTIEYSISCTQDINYSIDTIFHVYNNGVYVGPVNIASLQTFNDPDFNTRGYSQQTRNFDMSSIGITNFDYVSFKIELLFLYVDTQTYGKLIDDHENIYLEGYLDGKDIGEHDGYRDGYNDAKAIYENMNDNMTTIFSGILDIALVPVNFFLGILNFEVFGINIGGFVSGLLCVAVVVIIIRSIVGGNKSD